MLYYSHINEDSRPERDLLHQYPYRRVVGIAGSGERLIALMDQPAADRVYAIDNNEEALFLLELKLLALRELSTQDYLLFTGALPEGNPSRRIDHYTALRTLLSARAHNYWDKRTYDIEIGILNIGHFECFLARIRPLLRWVLGKSFYQPLYAPSSGSTRHQWFLLRWHILQMVFSLRWPYMLFGNRDLAFIASDADIKRIPEGLHQLITEKNASASYITHLIFEGHLRHLPAETACPSLQPQLLERVSRRLKEGRLQVAYIHGDWQQECRQQNLLQTPDTFYSLSDILSFESKEYLLNFLTAVFAESAQRKTVVIRSFLRNVLSQEDIRQLNERFPKLQIKDLSAQESSHMYQVLALCQAHPPK